MLYARFIGNAVDYALNRHIETTLVKDRDSLASRDEHPDEVVTPAPRDCIGGRSRAAVGRYGMTYRVTECRLARSLGLSAIVGTFGLHALPTDQSGPELSHVVRSAEARSCHGYMYGSGLLPDEARDAIRASPNRVALTAPVGGRTISWCARVAPSSHCSSSSAS